VERGARGGPLDGPLLGLQSAHVLAAVPGWGHVCMCQSVVQPACWTGVLQAMFVLLTTPVEQMH